MYRFIVVTSASIVAGLISVLALAPAQERADLVVANSDECRTLDPHLATWTHETRLCQSLYEGLTRLDPQSLRPVPGVAESWEVSEDGRVYTFHLRPQARWSNGEPVTAADFVNAWERSLNPRTGSDYSHQAFIVRRAGDYHASIAAHDADRARPVLPFDQVGVRARDGRTLEVTLERPCAYFLEMLAMVPFWPMHRPTYERTEAYVWPESFSGQPYDAGLDNPSRRHVATRAAHFVGNGAFRLAAWQFKRRIRLEKNPQYWDAANVRVRTIDVLPVADANTRFLGFETGAWDLTTDPPPLVARRLTDLVRAGRRRDYYNQDLLATYFYRFNCTRFPTDDKQVRRALSLAVDRRAICEQVLGCDQVPATAFVPYPTVEAMARLDSRGRRHTYQPPEALRFDPLAARQTLVDAGWSYPTPADAPAKDGRPFPVLEITYNTDRRHQLVAAAVARMWQQHLGLRVQVRNVELKVFYERERKLDYMISRGSWFADYVDPAAMLLPWTGDSGHNRTGWWCPEYDALLAAAEAELDVARRFALLAQAEGLLTVDELPVMPLFYYTGSTLISERVGGLRPNVRNLPFLHAAYVRQEGER